MLATFVSLALVLAPALTQVNAFKTYYPNEVGTCQELSFAWVNAAVWPVDVLVVNPADPCGDALIDIGEVEGTSASAKVNQVPGTKIQLSLLDADDKESWSDIITVTDSGDYSCLDSEVAASLSAAASSAAATTSATTLVVSNSVSATKSAATSTGSTGSYSTSDDDDEKANAAPVGAVGSDNTFGDNSGASPFTVSFGLLGASLVSLLFL